MPQNEIHDDPLWYKDAVVYELHVKTFRDSNGDGIGDFRGLISKLDYLQDLGITALWLLPFYPSPLKDDGYDIADYAAIHPQYGDIRDFREFLRQAHRRGMRVITEIVLNHTSDQHPWFKRARNAAPGSRARNYYVWSDSNTLYSDARIIFKDFESSNWTWDNQAQAYYWHRFYSHQPDLNYDNPVVRSQMKNAIDFWLEMGVDGLRLDAVPYLIEQEGTNCENLPETHEVIKEIRAHIEAKYKNRMLLAEANQWPDDTAAYFGAGDECHMAFNFPLMPRMYVALQTEDRFPIVDILDPAITIPSSCQWAMFLRNHDELTLEMVSDEERDYMYRYFATDPRAKINLGIRRRLAPLLNNNRRRIELMNMLLFSLPGTPVIYYGDEIGMGDNFHLGDRNGVRTPMQWSPDRNAGFSGANPQSLYLPLIIDPEYHYEVVNVENQQRNLSSLLWWMKRVISMRKKHRAFGRGNMQLLSPDNPRVFAFIRQYEEETILVVANLSRFSQPVTLDLAAYAGRNVIELFSRNSFPPASANYPLTLGPHNYFWFTLEPEQKPVELAERNIPKLVVEEDPAEIFSGKKLLQLEQIVFPEYIRNRRWYQSKNQTLLSVEIIEQAALPIQNRFIWFLIVRCNFRVTASEMYFLPVAYEEGTAAEERAAQAPQSLMARIERVGNNGILYDAAHGPALQLFLLEMIYRKRSVKAEHGRFKGSASRRLRRHIAKGALPGPPELVGTEQSNTSISYGRKLMLKLYRKVEEGIHPDAELVKALTETASFSHTPKYAGEIFYQARSGSVSFCLLQEFMPNQGNAWNLALAQLQEFADRALARRPSQEEPLIISFIPREFSPEQYPLMNELIGRSFCDSVELMGRRVAEMHVALSTIQHPDFAPEFFSALYQKSIYHSMRGRVRKCSRMLKQMLSLIPPEIAREAEEMISSEDELLSRLGRIATRKIPAMKIRIHGDLHLGQMLYTGNDFLIIDFEGEPQRAISERRIKRSPLRDVASMIRSFHYAAYSALFSRKDLSPADRVRLEGWLRPWYHYISNLFVHGYLGIVKESNLIPRRYGDLRVLLDSFILDKAVYEVAYELGSRPDWIGIPIMGIRYILAEERAGSDGSDG